VSGESPALLVVDDNDDNRYTLIQRLKRQGYINVTTATNGVEALARLREQPFDLVLLDVTMPEMNGYEVLERLKADTRLRHLPVIMISAVDQVESVVRCIELGAEDYLSKPFNPTLLGARVGASLEKKRLRDELEAHVARIEADLESARQIQLSMVPHDFPAPTPAEPVEIFAALHPARQVGGDLYDFFPLGPQTLCVVVADVSDKGAAAALFMARTKTLVRTLATAMRGAADGATPDPHEMVARMNEELCQDNPHSMFATVLLATLDLASRELRFCNAGHPSPYVVGAGGVRALEAPRAKPLGIRRTSTYVMTRRQLQIGECLFLFTDGVTEALDVNGELFGEARLEGALQSVAEDSPERVVSSVVEAVRRFACGAPQSDDIAVVAVRLVGEPQMARRAVATITSDRDVPRLVEVLDELARTHALDAHTVADMQVALDEVVSNVLRYGFADGLPHRIEVTMSVDHGTLVAEIEDDCAPFDPLTAALPDLRGSLKDRAVGGLGLHFVRKLMSDVNYSRARVGNRLVLRKAFGHREGDFHGAA